MQTKKIIQRVAVTLIVLSLVVLAGLTIYQQQQIKKMRSEATPDIALNDSPEDKSPDVSTAVSRQPETSSIVNGQGDPEIEDLQYQLDAAEEELDMAQGDLSEELEKKAELKNSMIEMQRQQLQNPATKSLIRNSLKTTFQPTFGRLFEKLGLSDEKQSAFLDLMADQQMEALDMYSQILGASQSEEEKKAFAEQNKALTEKTDDAIVELLGSENSEVYFEYKERLQERSIVSTFLASLGADSQLTESQEDTLIDAMYEGRRAVEEGHSSEDEILSPTDIDEEGLTRLLEVLDGRNAAYLESAEALLTEAQAEQFESYLEQQRQLQETALRMTSGLFGN